MYHKIIVPLDGSDEAEKVLPIAWNVLAPGGEVVLMQVVPPVGTQSVRGPGGFTVHPAQLQEAAHNEAMAYLESVRKGTDKAGDRSRCEAVMTGSIADGIAEFAGKEDADLIAMYTHDRKGLAKLIKGSVAEKVQRRAPIEVQVFRPWELAPEESESLSGRISTLKEGLADGSQPTEAGVSTALRAMLSDIGPFSDLSAEQLDLIASLMERAPASAGDVLGKAGDVCDYLYMVMHGEAQLSVSSSAGELTVRIAGPGESFPLSSLIGSGTSITSAKALTDMELLVLPRHLLAGLCTQNPELGLKIYRNISQLVAGRYSRTLEQLAHGEERIPQDVHSLTSI